MSKIIGIMIRMAEEIKKEEPLRINKPPRRPKLLSHLAGVEDHIPFGDPFVCAMIGKNAITNELVEQPILNDLNKMFNGAMRYQNVPYDIITNCRHIALKSAAVELNKAGKFSKKLTDQEIEELVINNETEYKRY